MSLFLFLFLSVHLLMLNGNCHCQLFHCLESRSQEVRRRWAKLFLEEVGLFHGSLRMMWPPNHTIFWLSRKTDQTAAFPTSSYFRGWDRAPKGWSCLCPPSKLETGVSAASLNAPSTWGLTQLMLHISTPVSSLIHETRWCGSCRPLASSFRRNVWIP